MALRNSILFLLFAALAACAIDTVPLPDVERGAGGAGAGAGGEAGAYPFGDQAFGAAVNPSAIYWADQGVFVYLVGVPGAFPGAGMVIVNNPDRGDEYRGTAASDGSFAAAINAQLFDTIQVSFVRDNSIIDSVLIDLIPGSVGAYAANSDLEGNLPPAMTGGADSGVRAEAAPASDTVTVYGPPGLLPPGIGVIIANPRLGSAARAFTGQDGAFSAVLLAASGDQLLVFTVEPAQGNGGSSTLTLIVP